MKKQIKEIFEKENIILEENEIEKFANFLEIFKEKNSQINLSAIREDKDIIIKHFLDSIYLNVFVDFQENEKILDLWTGWWFPLIPLAIINPKNEFVGLDSVWKKLKAIDEFSEKLWLKNVKTIKARAEELWHNPDYREQFDFVVSRATAFFPVLLEYAIPFLKVGWILAAYKLEDKQELNSIKTALKKLHSKIIKIKNYKINSQDRVIIFIEKQAPTHKKYPRKVGIPMQKPL